MEKVIKRLGKGTHLQCIKLELVKLTYEIILTYLFIHNYGRQGCL